MTIFNYTVNYVDVIIVGIMLLFMIIGWARGIFITVVNLIRYALGFFLCTYCSNSLAQPIYDGFVKERIVNTLAKKVVTSANIDEISANLTQFVDNLPDIVKSNLDVSTLSIKSGDDIAASISDSLFQPIAMLLLKGIIFIAVFVIFFGITGIIISALQRRSKKKNKEKKSVLKTTDRLFGCIFGGVKGIIIVFVFVSCVDFISQLEPASGSAFVTKALDSSLYNYIISFNPFNVITEGLL